MDPRSPDDADLERLFEDAENALEEGEYERALELLDEPAHARDPDPEARALYGLALFYLGEYEDTFEYLTDAVDADPSDVECRGALGVCHFYRLELVTAEKELRRALLEEPDWAEARYWLGRVLDFRGRRIEAEREFRRAHALDDECYPLPEHLSGEELDRVIHDAVDGLPELIRKPLDEVTILVDEYPDEEVLRVEDPPFPPDLLGLFSGPALTERSSLASGSAPNTIHVFRRNVELYAGTRDEVVDELRLTLLHEIGHFLGLDEEELEKLGLE